MFNIPNDRKHYFTCQSKVIICMEQFKFTRVIKYVSCQESDQSIGNCQG